MRSGNQGFSLIELLIAMVITGLVTASVYTVYRSQQDAYIINDQVASMQQNIRSAVYFMLREIRTAGYDPMESGRFGITDIRHKDLDDNVAAGGNASLEFTRDYNPYPNGNGVVDGGEERVYFALYDYPEGSPDGKLDLARRVGGGARQLLAENVAAMGLAYGFDSDGNGSLDTYVNTGGAESIIWAVDTDDDNALDRNLDTNGDGVIDRHDDQDGDQILEGRPLPGNVTVGVNRIRAVRVWLLVRADRNDAKFLNQDFYTVGERIVEPQAGVRMRLLESTVECRNLGL